MSRPKRENPNYARACVYFGEQHASLLEKIKARAKAENRTISNMILVMLAERAAQN